MEGAVPMSGTGPSFCPIPLPGEKKGGETGENTNFGHFYNGKWGAHLLYNG